MSRKSKRERLAAFAAVNQATNDMKRAVQSPKGMKQGLREQARSRRRWYHDVTLPIMAVLAIVGIVTGLHYADRAASAKSSHPCVALPCK